MSERFTINQAARALGVSERTLRRHIKAGRIQAAKDQAPGNGGSWFIERAVIEALRRCPPKQEEKEVHPEEEAPPEILSRLLLRVDELARHGAALEERIMQLERECEEQREGERKSEPLPRTRWPFRRKAKDEVPQPT